MINCYYSKVSRTQKGDTFDQIQWFKVLTAILQKDNEMGMIPRFVVRSKTVAGKSKKRVLVGGGRRVL